jgi:plastocyanin
VIALLTALVLAVTTAPNPIPAAPAPAFVVHIKDFAYAPAPLRIHVGDTVKFINDDEEPHTVTATDKSFDSTALDTNGTWTHTFTKAGTFAYFCELHPYMKATVIVTTAPSAALTGAGA